MNASFEAPPRRWQFGAYKHAARARLERTAANARALQKTAMDPTLKATVTGAASLSAVALFALTVGLPLMLNEMAMLETAAAVEHAAFIDLSNRAWLELRNENEAVRVARAVASRHRRQCELRSRWKVVRSLCSLQTAKRMAPQPAQSAKLAKKDLKETTEVKKRRLLANEPQIEIAERGEDAPNGHDGAPGNGAIESDDPYGGAPSNFDSASCKPCPIGPPGWWRVSRPKIYRLGFRSPWLQRKAWSARRKGSACKWRSDCNRLFMLFVPRRAAAGRRGATASLATR